MENKQKTPCVIIECKLKDFISEDVPDGASLEDVKTEEKKHIVQKIIEVLEIPFMLIGEGFVNQFTVEKKVAPPPPHPNELFNADNTCRNAIESAGYKPVVYSREDSYRTIKGKGGKEEKGARTETMFKFLIQPEVGASINEIIENVDRVLQDTDELTDRFEVTVRER